MNRTIVIAEMACSHEGEIALAKKIIDSSAKAKAEVMEGFRMEPLLPPPFQSLNFLFNFNLITSYIKKDTINDNSLFMF